MDSAAVEKIIEVATRLKQSVSGLFATYQTMAAVIAKETRAIKAYDLPAIAAAGSEKTLSGDQIEAYYSAMMQSGADLNRLANALLQPAGDDAQGGVTAVVIPRATSLTELSQLLNTLAAHVTQSGFAGQVLNHVAATFAAEVATTLQLCHEVKPLIEANRHLVAALLRNFQESYRFWQEVTEQIAVSYNASGVQKAAGRNSGFKASA